MKISSAIFVFITFAMFVAQAQASCGRFVGSTMDVNVSPVADWRTDYPASSSAVPMPWLNFDFATQSEDYMNAVLETVRSHFTTLDGRLVAPGSEPWWISEWMDYDLAGREPHMGLTKERGPKKGDLSGTSMQGPQVWAVGFYNEPGAFTLGKVFDDPCDPTVPATVIFPDGTVAIKFLFTDANLGAYGGQVSYLDGGPKFKALIDPEGKSSAQPVQGRKERDVQLVQFDLGVKDRATKTGWVFGTYAWIGPKKATACLATSFRFPSNGQTIKGFIPTRFPKVGSTQLSRENSTAGRNGQHWALTEEPTVRQTTFAPHACLATQPPDCRTQSAAL